MYLGGWKELGRNARLICINAISTITLGKVNPVLTNPVFTNPDFTNPGSGVTFTPADSTILDVLNPVSGFGTFTAP